MKTTFSIVTFALLAAGLAVAGEPSEQNREELWFEYSVADGSAIPVPCLGPAVYMEGTEHVVVWSREYFLPTGVQVFSFKFRNDAEFHDQDGNTWIGSGEVHGKDVVLVAGASTQYVAHITFKPVLGDLGMWQMRNVGMIRVKADGKIVVDRPPGYTWEEIERCVPAKKK